MSRVPRILGALCAISLALACVWTSAAWAHPGVDEQIRDLTARIEKDPSDATLFLRRGELHRIHRDWKAAEADYLTASKLDPELVVAEFCLGRLNLETGKPAEAKRILDSYLTKRPADSEALAARGRALVKLGQHLAAAEDFTTAIRSPDNRRRNPAYYLERARALEAAGPEHVHAAIAGLDEGMQDLGPVVTLQLYAIDLDIASKRYESALARLDTMSQQSVRQEPWLVRRGSILEAAGRANEARRAYEQALQSIDALPASRKTNRAVQRLESEARTALRRLDDGAEHH